MKKSYLFVAMLAMVVGLGFTACSSSDDDDKKPGYGLEDDSNASAAPTVTTNTVTISNISSPSVEAGTGGSVGNLTLTGIKSANGDYMELRGTGLSDQNFWVTIDGKPKAVEIINSDDVSGSTKKGQADIVFLIDVSGSMDEEADSVAKQIVDWAQVISKTVDAKFGCVGYGDGYYGIDGALDMTDINGLSSYLNREGTYGVYRGMGFEGPSAEKFSGLTQTSDGGYTNGYWCECGALALHFADEQFAFREGANRIYINFTDEPNQPNGYKQWSVETLNPANTELYNWNTAKGTVHSVYSESDTLSYEAPDGYYYQNNVNYPFTQYEKPWAMSEYTDGITLFADSDFRNFTLNGLEVTSAIVSSYIIRFNITDDLKSGVHTIVLTIKDKKGNQAVKKFENVSFGF